MKTKAVSLGLAAALSAATVADASQGNLYSPTTGTVSGVALTQNYNGALAALASCNSGAAAPANTVSTTPYAGMCWLNTAASPNSVMVYDGADWLLTGYLDPVNHLWEPVIGGGAGTITATTTTDLGSQTPSFLTVNGTATITGFGSSAPLGAVKTIEFSSAGSTLTNSATLILPSGANITTAAGDLAIALQTAAGTWRVMYFPSSGESVASSVPSGAVMAFNLSSCPAGWVAANGLGGTANMLGTVARGYDPGNTRDPNGSSQSIGSYEADMFQQHTETQPGSYPYSSIFAGGASIATGAGWGISNATSTGLSNSGNYGPETRAKSTILLYCQKS